MKSLIKGGLCLALGWLANNASAQEIQWRAANPKSPPTVATSVLGDSGFRGVSVGKPLSVGSPSGASMFQPIIRAQAPDEKILQVEPLVQNDGKQGNPLPKDPKFVAPAPSPVFGTLGMTPENGFIEEGGVFGLHGACCPPRPRFWVSGEYLMWTQRGQTVPPLVVTSPVGTNPLLGLNTTSIVYDNVASPLRHGGRFSAGMWMPHFCCNLGIETTFFFLGRVTTRDVYSSNGNPVLGRPFFDVTPGNVGQNAEVFAGPNVIGSATINTYSQVWGVEGNLRYKWRCGSNYWIDLIGGYRHLNLSEGLDITEDAQTIGQGGAPGIRFLEQESFRTRNQFNGMQIGIDGERRFWNRCFVGATSKLALGNVHQIVNIDGSTTFSNVPAPFAGTQPGALLATPTNMGRYTANRFGVLPEFGIKVGMDVTDHLRVFVGYNCLYLNSVVRPGEQIDTNVNQAFRPFPGGVGIGGGTRQPQVLLKTSDYWAQGMTFGLLYRY